MKEITQELVCELDEAELVARGQALSTAMIRHDETEAAKKEATKDFAEELKALRGEMRRLSATIRRRNETRTVTCVVEFHKPEVGMKRVVRMDTGEIVRDERMTNDECQNNLWEDLKELRGMYGQGASPEPPETELPPEKV